MPKVKIKSERQTLYLDPVAVITTQDYFRLDYITFTVMLDRKIYMEVSSERYDLSLITSEKLPPIQVTANGFIFEMASKTSSKIVTS
jgi:hypothetical protein